MDINKKILQELDRILSNVEDERKEEVKYHLLGRLLTKPFNIENSFKIKKSRGWEYFFVYVDIHSTILEPDYGGLAKKYYPYAEKTLKMLSDRDDVKLIMYTCSYTNEITQYLDFFSDSDIEFDGINRYPVENTRGGDFTDKPYFNVLLEDKAGFVGDKDWYIVDYLFNKYPLTEKK